MADSEIKVGKRVRLLIDSPSDEILEGAIAVLQDDPGKQIGIELDNYHEGAHSLDGALAPEKVDETNGRTFGKGWWTREENIEVL